MVKVSARPKRLLQVLAAKNISQRRLAKMAGFASGYVSQILSGARKPSANARKKLLDTINKSQRIKGLKEYTFDDLFAIE